MNKVAKMLQLTSVREVDVSNEDLEHQNFSELTNELIQTTSSDQAEWSEIDLGNLVACLQYSYIVDDANLTATTDRCLL